MKYFILLICLTYLYQAHAQDITISDTILSQDTNYIVSKNKRLYSNLPLLSWSYLGTRYRYNRELIICEKNQLYGILDLKNEELLLPFEYDLINDNSHSLDSTVSIRKNNLKGLYFPFEKKLIPVNNKKAFMLRNNSGYILFRNDTLMIYDKKHILISVLNNIDNLIELGQSNKIKIERNGKYGLINSRGDILVPINYSSIKILENGNYILGTKKGYAIHKKENLKKLTKSNFYSYTRHNNITIAMSISKMFFYNSNGKLLNKINGRLDPMPINKNGYYFYENNKLWGILSYTGDIIKDPVIQKKIILPGNRDYFKAQINNDWKLLDYHGNEVGPDMLDNMPQDMPVIDGG